MNSADTLAARKALIAAQSELARIELALAWHDLRNVIAPPASSARSTSVRRTAAFLIAVATPLFGRSRFARIVRIASIALAAFRVVRGLRF